MRLLFSSARVVLLATSVLLLTACARTSPKHDRAEAAPLHELFTQTSDAAPAARPSPGAWPLMLTSEGTTFQVYEPIVDSWDGSLLTGRSVVLAQPPFPAQSVLGTVTIKALTQGDSAAAVVPLASTEVLGVSFPAAVDKTQAWQDFLRFAVPPKITALPLAALETGRGIDQTRQSAALAAVTAPKIIVSEHPAMLVYIDGNPRYAPVRGGDLEGVLNTRAVLLKDRAGTYYLHLYDGWVSAPSLSGPWQVAPTPPGASQLEQRARASGRVNLLLGKTDAQGKRPSLSAGPLPDIIVTQEPTALIVLDGEPRYAAVSGTSFEHAVNTSAHLFRDTTSGKVYVRIDGYWFRAEDTNGPWSYVPAANRSDDLPAMPRSGPGVTAVDRRTAVLSVSMDGDPVIEPIPGTALNYVANASVPVIQVDIDNWYAVQNGVWFYATRVIGPWTVTRKVPLAIYSIPPGVPIYHAIHSRVMASSADITYYGYPSVDSHAAEGGAAGVEEQGDDYQYTPPSGLYWGWLYL